MRSELIFEAKSRVPNRFLLAKLLAKATRCFHRPGSRIADTTNDVLARFSLSDPISEVQAAQIPSPASRHDRSGYKTARTSRSLTFPREAIHSNSSLDASGALGI
jgi:hypothetical protein